MGPAPLPLDVPSLLRAVQHLLIPNITTRAVHHLLAQTSPLELSVVFFYRIKAILAVLVPIVIELRRKYSSSFVVDQSPIMNKILVVTIPGHYLPLYFVHQLLSLLPTIINTFLVYFTSPALHPSTDLYCAFSSQQNDIGLCAIPRVIFLTCDIILSFFRRADFPKLVCSECLH